MKCLSLGLIQTIFIIILSMMTLQNSWALRCLEGGKESRSFDITKIQSGLHGTSIGNIRISSTSQAQETLLWESEQITVKFTCYDDSTFNRSENAYLYLDDQKSTIKNRFQSGNLVIGIRYNGREYPINSAYRIDTGKLAIKTQPNRSNAIQNCNFIKKRNSSCADPQTVTLTYSIYIKSNPKMTKKVNLTRGTFYLFQVSGVGGRRIGGNFYERISQLTTNYIECTLKLSTENVDLGSYSSFEVAQQVIRKTPFAIHVETEGSNCAKYPFSGKFTSNQKYDDHTITAIEPSMKNIVGIQIFSKDSNESLSLDQKIDFGYSHGGSLVKEFDAGVIFLKKPTSGGVFTSTLKYEVYFK